MWGRAGMKKGRRRRLGNQAGSVPAQRGSGSAHADSAKKAASVVIVVSSVSLVRGRAGGEVARSGKKGRRSPGSRTSRCRAMKRTVSDAKGKPSSLRMHQSSYFTSRSRERELTAAALAQPARATMKGRARRFPGNSRPRQQQRPPRPRHAQPAGSQRSPPHQRSSRARARRPVRAGRAAREPASEPEGRAPGARLYARSHSQKPLLSVTPAPAQAEAKHRARGGRRGRRRR